MPAEYRIDRELGVVLSRAWGVLTDGDLLDHQRRLLEDPRFDSSLNQLFDFLEVDDVQVTSSGIRVLADRSPFREGSRRAFSIKPGAAAMYGLMRMFQILTSDYPDELRVQFNDLAKARVWLGMPDVSSDPHGRPDSG